MLSAQLLAMYSDYAKDFSEETQDEKTLALNNHANGAVKKDLAIPENGYLAKIIELRRDKSKLGYALPDYKQRLLMPVIFALRSGVSLLKIKGALMDDISVIDQAEKYIADARLEKLTLYFKIKETCKQQSEDQLIVLVACFIQQMGALQELKNALGTLYKKDLVEKALARAKQTYASLITMNEGGAKNLDFIIREFQATFLNDKELSSKEEINRTRESYISILSELKKSYDAVNNVYSKEIEVTHSLYYRQAISVYEFADPSFVSKIREGAIFERMNKAHDKFRDAYKNHIPRMIKTLKDMRKTYPRDAKEPMTSEFLIQYLPMGTAFGWMQKEYKSKKAVTEASPKTVVNLLNMKQIEEDLDSWLRSTHRI